MNDLESATVAALLTPPGRGAIATIWLSGPDALSIVDRLFRGRRARSISTATAGRILYGMWEHLHGREEVVVVPLDRHTAEINAHGGAIAADSILRALEASGVTRIDPATALLRQCHCQWQAAAVIAATQSFTLRAADRLLANADGRLTRAIAGVCKQLSGDRHGWPTAVAALESLRESYDTGSRMIRGWEIAIAGRPNVGKSSLINRLLGYDRSIVLDRPGTTRDLIRERSAVAGWPVVLVDMAGIRDSDCDVERIGVEWARSSMQKADTVIWVSDSSQPWDSEDQQWLDRLPRVFHLINKSDLARAPGSRPAGLTVSLLRDPTIDGVLCELERRLFDGLPPSDLPLLVASWQYDAIDNAHQLIAGGRADEACRRLQSAGPPENRPPVTSPRKSTEMAAGLRPPATPA